jgi:hypothetical protein
LGQVADIASLTSPQQRTQSEQSLLCFFLYFRTICRPHAGSPSASQRLEFLSESSNLFPHAQHTACGSAHYFFVVTFLGGRAAEADSPFRALLQFFTALYQRIWKNSIGSRIMRWSSR